MENNETKTVNLFEMMDVPREYFTIDKPKREISKQIKEYQETHENSSLRNMAKALKELYKEDEEEPNTPHYNTITQITSSQNYTIDSLLYLLDLMGKKIVIMDRTPEEEEFINKRGKVNM